MFQLTKNALAISLTRFKMIFSLRFLNCLFVFLILKINYSDSYGNDNFNLIVNGNATTQNEFPYQTFILIVFECNGNECDASNLCGGTIANQRHIVTAGI